MRLVTVLLLTLLVLPLQAEQVYRQTDAQGRTVFTDQPSPQAEAVEVAPVNTTPAVDARPRPQADPKLEYSVRIVSPTQNAIIPNGLVPLTVVTEAAPGFGGGLRVRLSLDGEQVGVSADGQFVIPQLSRGPHQLEAQLVDSDNRVVAEADPVSLFAYWPGG